MPEAVEQEAERPEPPRHRPLLPVLIGFAAGIAADGTWTVPFAAWLAAGLLAVLMGLLVRRVRAGAAARWLMGAIMLLPVGGAYHWVRFRHRPPWHASRLLRAEAARLHVRGTVRREAAAWRWSGPLRFGEQPATHWRSELKLCALSADGEHWVPCVGGIVVLSAGGRPTLRAGDDVEFMALAHGNSPPSNPGETDRSLLYARRDSFGLARVDSPRAFRLLHRPPWWRSPAVALGRLRWGLKARLIWETDAPTDGITGALIFGERGRLDREERDLMGEAGSIHFLAISGLHVGMFAGLVWLAFALTGLPVQARCCGVLGMIWLYILFTGAPVSAQRAGWMLSVMLAAPLLGRRWDPTSGLVAAALLMLLLRPQELFSVGFQFTFLAMWAIFCLYYELRRVLWPLEDMLRDAQDPGERSLWGELAYHSRHYFLLSASVWLALAPLTASHFKHFSLLTPLINLVLWPLVLPLIAGAFLLVPASLVGGAAEHLLAGLTGFLAGQVKLLLNSASHLPGFVTYGPAPPVWWIAAFYGVLVFWVVRGRVRAGRWAFLAGVVLLGGAYIASDAAGIRSGVLTVTVADVGHGQCVALRLPSGATMLYDAGSYSAGRAAAVAEALWAQHIRRIGALVISHRDYDHCSFVPYLRRRFEVRTLVMPPLVSADDRLPLERGLHASARERAALAEGGRLRSGDLECVALHPSNAFLASAGVSDNDRSLVLMCEWRGWRILLTGDLQQQGMQRLVADYGERLRADVLVLPHHGAYSPALPAFLEQVRPRVAVASRHGPLDEATATALREVGAKVWGTSQSGAITLAFDDEQLSVRAFRSGRAWTVARAAGGPSEHTRMSNER